MKTQKQTNDLKLEIQQEANKVLDDVVKLSKQLKAAGLEHAEEVGSQVLNTINDQIKQLEPHGQRAWEKVENFGREAHTSVKNHPYSYIGGALGIGYVLGRLFSAGHHRKEPLA